MPVGRICKAGVCFFLALSGFASILDHCKTFEHTEGTSIDQVDCIYLINLDQRKERLQQCNRQLNLYKIYPQRFPAIYGWSLPEEVLQGIGVCFKPGMWSGREFVYDVHFHPTHLNESKYGQTFFSQWSSRGAIGCTLSHLSVLKDAYDLGYETIWVLEDDLLILENPRQLSALIEELSMLDNWDILYTDCDYWHEKTVDLSRDLLSQTPWMWRPDLPHLDLTRLFQHISVSNHFEKIGCRIRAHSILYRRSGIKKILEFYKQHNLFAPYDWEIALVPDLKLYVPKRNIVTVQETSSDTKQQNFSL